MSSVRSLSGGMHSLITFRRKYKILAERAGFDLRSQLTIGGGDHPDVDASMRPIGADALNFAGLEKAKQHRLHARTHLARLRRGRRCRLAPSPTDPACRGTLL